MILSNGILTAAETCALLCDKTQGQVCIRNSELYNCNIPALLSDLRILFGLLILCRALAVVFLAHVPRA